MSEASKRAQQKYVEKNKDKLNEYKAKKAKEKYNNDDDYRNKKKETNLNHYYKLQSEGKCFKGGSNSNKFKENNPEYCKEYSAKYNPVYYKNNKERILKMIGEKVSCPCCDTMIRKDFFHKHIKTNKHIKNELAAGIHSDNSN